ncbi:GNAT family N-acetyltransferase [Rossellomorea sp. AcN35-11]|nr:GNAT family N-acetyltransferase [Rossellomorea aquimaris]WJV28691.1 GNAT family N-acetyltransferase [Rossellomorea sp. AcN35-11]
MNLLYVTWGLPKTWIEKRDTVSTLDHISLEFYHDKYKPQLSNYHLSDEQMRYTSLPMRAINKCSPEKERFPIVILHEGEAAGFFVLHGWDGVKAYWNNRRAILVRAYSIHPEFQGKGVASKSIKRLDTFLSDHFKDKNEMILAVNHQNTVAQHVYKKGGFLDTGVRVTGRIGEMLILHKFLGQSAWDAE